MKYLTLLLVFISFAIPQEILDQVFTWLMPLIIYVVTWAITKFKTLLPGWAVIILVGVLSGVATLLTQILANPELVWWQQFLWNLLAVVVSQIKIQFSSEKIAEDKKNLK